MNTETDTAVHVREISTMYAGCDLHAGVLHLYASKYSLVVNDIIDFGYVILQERSIYSLLYLS